MILKRRRFLLLSAAASLAGLSHQARAKAPVAIWEGMALGAKSRIVIAGLPQADATEVFDQMTAEISRLESIFSLYRPESEIRRLNRDGQLKLPSPDFLQVLGTAKNVWLASGGAFDPTIQTLWRARFEADEVPLRSTDSLADLEIQSHEIRFSKSGMAITLNGIAQGFVTDRLTYILGSHGLKNIAVNAGETRVLGQGPEGQGWRLGIQSAAHDIVSQRMLNNRAVATSSPEMMTLKDGSGHIIDARSGRAVNDIDTISIASDTAMLADALSTAASCLSLGETDQMLRQFFGSELLWRS